MEANTIESKLNELAKGGGTLSLKGFVIEGEVCLNAATLTPYEEQVFIVHIKGNNEINDPFESSARGESRKEIFIPFLKSWKSLKAKV